MAGDYIRVMAGKKTRPVEAKRPLRSLLGLAGLL